MKLISPKEVINAVVSRYESEPEIVTISQAEGFIRQILGWREYMRGIYWMHMPGYASLNYFGYSRPLPSYFWTGDTNMRCVSTAVQQSLDYAYAHHIQRLMVTGNFCLLAGIQPTEVDNWYLGIYIDAFEWVEITNTRGMSQFADGGIVGSKPYVSSANYIHKMGDHCLNCTYDHKKKVGEGACPFNSLYWHFINRHEDQLSGNPRMSMMYRLWAKNAQQEEILAQAESYLTQLETL
jgi:deoxyribodipyrimidine photolyase-related protein